MTERLSRGLRVIRFVWIAGFVIGTTTHVADLVVGGVEVYAGYPDAARVFWVSLTLLDPAAVVLLLRRSRVGVVLGVAIMLADVAVNWTVFATIEGFGLFGLINQSLFCAFVLATAVPLWRAYNTPSRCVGRADDRMDG
ncbi:hypothetical protein [Conyzicola sp.]|uniref:hypothetical protein n=1 Tax=Conyzicola sp. TaxID=1969404 RepID=UPI0039898FE3